MVTDKTALMGGLLEQSRYINSGRQSRYVFADSSGRRMFAVDDVSVYKNVLLLGGAGSGKTNVVNQMVAQCLEWNNADRNSVSIIFDTKEDFISHPGFLRSNDIIIANGGRYEQESAVWNIFPEVLADGNRASDYESNAREISNTLFKGRGSQIQPFFVNAARDIFAATLLYFIRRWREEPERWKDNLNNRYLVDFLMSCDPVKLMSYFKRYPDLRGLSSYIGNGDNNQAMGVMSELRSMLNDCFQGRFASKPAYGEGFSVRKTVRRKGGMTIFVLYDMKLGEVLTPVYSLLIDMALKEALGSNAGGRVHLFLDELKLLPHLQHLEDALNFGRSKKLSVVAGLQSVSQIYAAYGEDVGKNILSGFGNCFAFKLNDPTSRKYISELYGTNLISYVYSNIGNQQTPRERDGYTVEDWDLIRLTPGQAVIGLASQTLPFLFTFEKDKFLG